MAGGILCSEGLKLEIFESGGVSKIALAWDDEPSHQIIAAVAPDKLFGVLNGMDYAINADPWTCVLRLKGNHIGVAVHIDEFELASCGFPRGRYEDALLTAFRTLRQAYRA